MRSTSSRHSARPSPLPPWRVKTPESAWAKRSKMRSSRSLGMPGPVSSTSISSPLPAPTSRSDTSTHPASVNFTALPTRFTRICRTRAGSPIRCGTNLGSMSATRASPFPCAAKPNISTQSWTRETASKESWRSSKRPDSRRESSSTFSSKSRSPRPARRNTWTYSRWSRCSGVPSSRSAMPRIAFSGVRISWLMAAMKEPLARAASSAARSPRSSARSASLRLIA